MVLKIPEEKEKEAIYTLAHKLPYTSPTHMTTKRNFNSLSLQPCHRAFRHVFSKHSSEELHLITRKRIDNPLPQVTVKAEQLSFHLCMHF